MNSKLKTILLLLSDGHFHSGADLGRKLNLTRGAIWKIIKQLESYQIKVDAKTNLGYRIDGGLELLDKKIISQYIDGSYLNLIKQMVILDETLSTTSYLAERLHDPKEIKICFAESQSAGRGRLGRSWFSPYGRNIYLSLLWQFDLDASEMGGFSLAVAVAAVRALEQYGIKEGVALKWPNDLVWQQKKLAGILIDLYSEANGGCTAMISIGLNVDMPEADISQPWCDIAEIVDAKPARNQLAGLLLNNIFNAASEFQQQKLKPFLKKWQQLDTTYGKKVIIITAQQKKIIGVGNGVDENGAFLLKVADGAIKKFVSGEVSLRQN